MRARQSAGAVFAALVVFAAVTIGACQEDAPPPRIPPVTSAVPDAAAIILAPAPAANADAVPSVARADAGSDAASGPTRGASSRVRAAFVDAPGPIEGATCARVLVAMATGRASALGETLGPGDVLVVAHGDGFELKGTGTAVVAVTPIATAKCEGRPAQTTAVVRGQASRDLRWAGGAMRARLDVGSKVSPELYLGRLEGTAGVSEHTHADSWEILAALDARGTFVLDGVEGHLGPRQIVIVPPGSRHSWVPDRDSKLVAIQMYAPPGPEERFVALAAADKDAGVAREAGAPR